MTDISLSEAQLLPALLQQPVEQPTGDQFLRLYLSANTLALLSVDRVAEVLSVPIAQVVPIPHLPAWAMGVYNWRGEILWMIDLAHLCGLTPWYQQVDRTSAHSVVVLKVQSAQTGAKPSFLGLVIHRVEEIEWCHADLIQPLSLSTIDSELTAFSRGYWWKSDDAILAVLDEEAIVKAMPQSSG